MPLIRRGSKFISLLHFILPNLTHCPACKPEVRGIAKREVGQVGHNKVLLRNKNYCPDTNEWRLYLKHIESMPFKIQLFNGNLINLTCFGGKAVVNKLWPLL